MAGTSYLYTGEQADIAMGDSYYLRARFYMPGPAMFTSLDPYFGDTGEPQSLHKYAHVHGDPVNDWDPSGMLSFSITGVLKATAIGASLGSITLGSAAAVFGGNVLGGIINGAVYGALAGVAFGIAWKDVDLFAKTLVWAILGALVGVVAELVYDWLRPHSGSIDPLQYRLVEAGVRGFAWGDFSVVANEYLESVLPETYGPLVQAAFAALLSYARSIVGDVLSSGLNNINWGDAIVPAISAGIISLVVALALQRDGPSNPTANIVERTRRKAIGNYLTNEIAPDQALASILAGASLGGSLRAILEQLPQF